MRFLQIFAAVLFCVTVWNHAVGQQTALPPASQVSIQIHPREIIAIQPVVTIGQVAELHGGSVQLRDQISSMDIDEFGVDQDVLAVTPNQIQYRVMLAGVPPVAFEVTGAERLIVRRLKPQSVRQQVESSMMEQLSEQFAVPREHVSIAIDDSSLSGITRSGIDWSSVSVRWEFGSQLPIGRKTVRGRLTHAGEKKSVVLSTDISIIRELVRVNQNIARGQVLTEDKIVRVAQPVSDPALQLVSYDQVVGRTARRDIQQFEVVRTGYVDTAPREPQLDIRRNQLVNAIHRVGRLNIKIRNARAVTDGTRGDSIEIINPITGKRMLGTVIDAGTVELH